MTDDKTTRDWLASLLFPLTTTMQTLNHSNTDLQSHLFQRLIDHPPAPLVQAIVDVHCGTTRVYPQRGGTILSKYGLRYETMMAIMRLSQTHQNSKSPFIEYSYSKPSHTSCLPKGKGCDKDLTRVEDILWLISNSPEVLEDCNITVRRTEKQVLNAMNASPEQMYRMTKPASTTTQRPGDLQNKLVKASRKLPRITTPSQKVFVLLVRVMSTRGQCLGDSNLGLRSDTARITKAAGRLIAAIAEFYSDDGLDNSNTNMFALNRAACTLREALSWRQGEQ